MTAFISAFEPMKSQKFLHLPQAVGEAPTFERMKMLTVIIISSATSKSYMMDSEKVIAHFFLPSSPNAVENARL